MPPGTRPRKQEPVPFSLNAMGIPSMGAPGSGDSEVVGRFLKGVATNVAGTVLTPLALTADAVRSVRAGRPQGVYADLVEAAKRVSRNPEAVPGMVMNYLREQGDRMRSSPGEAAEMLGEYVNPLGIGRSGPIKKDIFVGKGSRTWDPDKAEEFLNLENVLPRDETWQRTGTFRGRDRALRQEIDDSQSRLLLDTRQTFPRRKSFTLKDILDHPALYTAYPDFANTKVNVLKPSASGSYGSFEPNTGNINMNSLTLALGDQFKSTLLHELQHKVQNKEGWQGGGNPASARRVVAQALAEEGVLLGRMPNVPDDPVRRAQLQTEILQGMQSGGGGGGAVSMPANLFSQAIAQGEQITPELFNAAFARGTPAGKYWNQFGAEVISIVGRPPNPSKHPNAYTRWANNAAAQFDQIMRFRFPQMFESTNLEPLRNELMNLGLRDKLERELNERSVLTPTSSRDAYLKLGGEAESRATQFRRDMDLARRQMTHPYSNYDVVPEQIYSEILYPYTP
jgi:hypothetical protein